MVVLKEELRQLLKDNITHIYKCAHFFRPDPHDAKDLAHEVCVGILRAQSLDPTTIPNVKAYLRQCVLHAVIDRERIARSRSNRTEVALPEGDDSKLFRLDDPANRVTSYMDVRDAIRELDPEDRMLIYLVYYQGIEIKEAVGEATGLPVGKAYKRHQAVLKRLRVLLAEETD